jgi:3-mercaptopyruvate sulfurtransferase SseA
MLDARGVKSVRALVGGWNHWVDAGNKIVKGDRPTP